MAQTPRQARRTAKYIPTTALCYCPKQGRINFVWHRSDERPDIDGGYCCSTPGCRIAYGVWAFGGLQNIVQMPPNWGAEYRYFPGGRLY